MYVPFHKYMYVVYFDRCLGAAHAECWLKCFFQIFCMKSIKIRKNEANKWYPNSGQRFYSQKKMFSSAKTWILNVIIIHVQLWNTAIPKLVFVRLLNLDFNYFSLLKNIDLSSHEKSKILLSIFGVWTRPCEKK